MVELTLLNGWKHYPANEYAIPRARLFQGTVYLEGLLAHDYIDDAPIPSLIATLPIEFRPKAGRMIFTAAQTDGEHDYFESARIDVFPNGNIVLALRDGDGQWLPLNNVVYRVTGFF